MLGRITLLLVIVAFVLWYRSIPNVRPVDRPEMCACEKTLEPRFAAMQGALLTTRFSSLEQLKTVVEIEYLTPTTGSKKGGYRKSAVRLTHCNNGRKVVSVLESGIHEGDFKKARKGGIWALAWAGIRSPWGGLHKNDLKRVYVLARRRPQFFGEADPAWFDLAFTMVYHISAEDWVNMSCEDVSEKGYLNTFNHVTAQALITTLFSEGMADFVADAHERYSMPSLLTGVFSEEELSDFDRNPVDNYVDIINNEYGQELGKELRDKYQITRKTVWTPQLMANYLNDMQNYYSWALGISFQPFTPHDEVVTKFTRKLNLVMEDVSPYQ